MSIFDRVQSILQGEKKIIEVMDRKTGKTFQEIVFSEDGMRVLYGTRGGQVLARHVLSNTWVSKIYGAFNDSSASKHKIEDFATSLEIDLSECEKDIAEYNSFNDFFARKLKSGARPIDPHEDALISPGDGRLLVFPELQEKTLAYVKWAPLQLLRLFGGNQSLVSRFEGGSCLVLRLCPSDYHRFHFPVAGKVGMTKVIDGVLHSVNPYAIESDLPVYCLNKRTICEIESERAGKVALLEIGALFVGSIVQTYRAGMHMQKGDEKGYFKFGGSTVLAFFERGAVQFDDDLIGYSDSGLETFVKMGERIGTTCRN
jgi:phosphatidylserine decarboxylase